MATATPDPVFIEPDDPHVRVWRYMDFTKFMSVLVNRGLFFSRADRLGDPFEGSTSYANKTLRPEIYKDASVGPEVMCNFFDSLGKVNKEALRWMLVSCWHMNEGESATMWKLYAQTDRAVCLQSTFECLHACLPRGKTIHDVHMGVVRYIDYRRDWLPEGNIFYPLESRLGLDPLEVTDKPEMNDAPETGWDQRSAFARRALLCSQTVRGQ